ncbi:FecCD family ABC transporter permease [Brevibacillus fortis]|uniref:FecCD family ABC transporter permease n=1 Tax=Brevibacillus fortis TaxID=2126352 RepID=UPI0038FC4D9D
MTRRQSIAPALLLLLIVTAVISIGTGAVSISPREVVESLFGTGPKNHRFIIGEYRLPRVVLGMLAGAGLAVSGAILQGMIRNPLASPDVIGITKGAGLASAIVIFLFPKSPAYLLPLAAFGGAAVVAAILYVYTARKRVQPATLALVGIAIGVICQAGIQYLMVKNPGDVNAALLWMAGSLWGRGWEHVWAVLPWILVFLPIAFLLAYRLDVLSLGDDVAEGLGEDVTRLRVVLLVTSVALAGACVAVVGSIGFVGLLSPHIARRLVGGRHALLLPVAALLGATLMVAADGLGRWLLPPMEVPVGIVTAVIGAPYFLYLIGREKRRGV